MGLFYTALQRSTETKDAQGEVPGTETPEVRPAPAPPAGAEAHAAAQPAAGTPAQSGSTGGGDRARPLLGSGASPAAAPAEVRPLRDWDEARERDLAGFAIGGLEPGRPAAEARPVEIETLGWDLASLGPAANPEGAAKEQYRLLRTRLLQAMRGNKMRSLLITSAGPGEGKTLVTANLALELSALGEARVLLVDADLRRAGLSASLRPLPEAGLGEYLQGAVELDALVRVLHPWLSVLPALTASEDAPELLASARMRHLLTAWARERFDLILLDGAPVGPVVDSHILARMADASLLVVRAARTPTAELERAAEVLRPGLLGSVLNRATLSSRGGYGGYDRYEADPEPPSGTKREASIRP